MRNRSFTVLDSSAGKKDLISSKSSVVTWAIPGEVEDLNNVGPSQKKAKKIHLPVGTHWSKSTQARIVVTLRRITSLITWIVLVLPENK